MFIKFVIYLKFYVINFKLVALIVILSIGNPNLGTSQVFILLIRLEWWRLDMFVDDINSN